MKNLKSNIYKAILIIGMSFFASCAAEVVAEQPGGAVIVAPGSPPFAGAIWIGGEYRWDGHRYVTEEGHWERPRQGRTWVSGSWQHNRRGYAWKRGHWR